MFGDRHAKSSSPRQPHFHQRSGLRLNRQCGHRAHSRGRLNSRDRLVSNLLSENLQLAVIVKAEHVRCRLFA